MPAIAEDKLAPHDNSVQSVVVAVRVLDALAQSGQPMGVTEIGRIMGESKARVYRHLATLRKLGLVYQEAGSERYRLGWKLFQLGEAAAAQYDLRRVAEPYMVQLRDEVSETVVLGASINGETMILHAAECKARRVSISIRPGDRPQPHSSAQARIALAFAPPETVRRVLSCKGEAHTAHTLKSAAAVLARLELIRERFYESACNQYMLGINTLAMPIFQDGDNLAGTIAIIGSVQFITDPPTAGQIEKVRETAARISARLNSDRYARLARNGGKAPATSARSRGKLCRGSKNPG